MQALQIQTVPFKGSILKYNKANKSSYTVDIVPGVYEGGYKVWECTLDLLKFMSDNELGLAGKSVMDIGCGHGLLGIAALKSGGAICYFQDFNKEVLENVTALNAFINDVDPSCYRFAHGDWDNLVGMQGNEKFDIIVGAEIIYKQENYMKIIRLCQKYLKPGGRAILANKCFYFGVGGNVDDFRQAAQQNGFNCQTLLKIIPSKGGNKKEITALCWPA